MFYDRYYALCKDFGMSPTGVALELDISRGTVSAWKTRGTTPQRDILQKIAEYFDVSVDYLLNGEEKEKDPSTKAEVSDSDIKIALFGGDGEVTDAMWDEVKRFAEYVKQRERGKF